MSSAVKEVKGQEQRENERVKKQDNRMCEHSALATFRDCKNTQNNCDVCIFILAYISRWNRRENLFIYIRVYTISNHSNFSSCQDYTVVNTGLRSADLYWDSGLSVALQSTGIHESVVVRGRSTHTSVTEAA